MLQTFKNLQYYGNKQITLDLTIFVWWSLTPHNNLYILDNRISFQLRFISEWNVSLNRWSYVFFLKKKIVSRRYKRFSLKHMLKFTLKIYIHTQCVVNPHKIKRQNYTLSTPYYLCATSLCTMLFQA